MKSWIIMNKNRKNFALPRKNRLT